MRYFFHLRGPGSYMLDHEGELATMHDLREIASSNAREMLKISGLSVRAWLEHSYEIQTAEGVLVLALPFTEALDVMLF